MLSIKLRARLVEAEEGWVSKHYICAACLRDHGDTGDHSWRTRGATSLRILCCVCGLPARRVITFIGKAATCHPPNPRR